MRSLTTLIIISIALTSCSETKTNDPTESYKYWSGVNPPDDLKLLKGSYWQSAHWTKEYILYLKVKPTEKWWSEFVKQNKLLIDNGEWVKPSDSPDWFQPSKEAEVYKSTDDFYDSRFFKDKITGEFYIYVIQL